MNLQRPDNWPVEEYCEDERLDRYLAGRFPTWSRSVLHDWIDAQQVTVDGVLRKPSFRIGPGMTISVLSWPEKVVAERPIQPQDIPLAIVWEDSRMAVVDKPAGLVVHPGAGCPDGTLANALAFRYRKLSGLNGPVRPGIVHRLDKDTSGLLVVALDDDAHRHLAAQLADRSLSRTYDALVWGIPEERRVDLPIGRDPKNRIRMAVVADGRPAATRVKVPRPGSPCSLVECALETGRTHQIRVHLSHGGTPVVGDSVYGGGKERLDRIQPMDKSVSRSVLGATSRQCLHARAIRFRHPDGSELSFQSPWPADFKAAVDAAFPAV